MCVHVHTPMSTSSISISRVPTLYIFKKIQQVLTQIHTRTRGLARTHISLLFIFSPGIHCSSPECCLLFTECLRNGEVFIDDTSPFLQYSATRYNTLQHTATHHLSLQHTATHCHTLPHTATHCNTLQTDQFLMVHFPFGLEVLFDKQLLISIFVKKCIIIV